MTNLFTVDGRNIEARILGNGTTTVLFFHGFGSSSEALPSSGELLRQLDLQFVCPNRPGVGSSSLFKRYTPATVAADAKAILSQLQVRQCVVAGWSSGGLFAQAYSQAYPETVTALHLLNSAIPFANRDALTVLPGRWKAITFLNRYCPFVTKCLFRQVGRLAEKDPAALLKQSIRWMTEADKKAAGEKSISAPLLEATRQGFAQRGAGVYYEARALGRTKIDYTKITCPVHIWTGEQDTIWPPATAGYLLKKLPQSHLHIFRHSGHLLFLKEWEKIVTAFAAAPAC